MQYNGNNNGKLCAIHSQLGLRGFKSGDTITKAVRNLINANLIVLTKIGMFGKGKREPNYYAITWQPIDNIHGFDMDVNPTNKPIRQFSVELRR
jgi:predicted transcriptional regulator